MEQEFTITTWNKILNTIWGSLLIVAALLLWASLPINTLKAPIVLFAIIFFIGGALIIINQYRARITISSYALRRVNVFKDTEILIRDIKGVRIGDKVITIESFASSKIQIKNYSQFKNHKQLSSYFKETFPNLESIELRAEKKKVLADEAFGDSLEERKRRVNKNRQIAMAYNLIGFPAILFGLFNANTVTTLLTISFPLLGIALMMLGKGLTTFWTNNIKSVYSFVALGFFCPSFEMMLKSLLEFDISQYQNVWLPFLGIGSVIFLLLNFFGINKTIVSVTGQKIFMIVASLIYSYGSTIQINCVFDKSTPQLIHTTVYNKWIEHNKGAHYHLRLTSWDLNPKPKDIEVSRSTYNKYTDGDKIDVDLKKGVLNIPWYYLAN